MIRVKDKKPHPSPPAQTTRPLIRGVGAGGGGLSIGSIRLAVRASRRRSIQGWNVCSPPPGPAGTVAASPPVTLVVEPGSDLIVGWPAPGGALGAGPGAWRQGSRHAQERLKMQLFVHLRSPQGLAGGHPGGRGRAAAGWVRQCSRLNCRDAPGGGRARGLRVSRACPLGFSQ